MIVTTEASTTATPTPFLLISYCKDPPDSASADLNDHVFTFNYYITHKSKLKDASYQPHVSYGKYRKGGNQRRGSVK